MKHENFTAIVPSVATLRLPRTPVRVRRPTSDPVLSGARAARSVRRLGSWEFFALRDADAPAASTEERQVATTVASMPDHLSEILGTEDCDCEHGDSERDSGPGGAHESEELVSA